jgi:hypothetical protein
MSDKYKCVFSRTIREVTEAPEGGQWLEEMRMAMLPFILHAGQRIMFGQGDMCRVESSVYDVVNEEFWVMVVSDFDKEDGPLVDLSSGIRGARASLSERVEKRSKAGWHIVGGAESDYFVENSLLDMAIKAEKRIQAAYEEFCE